METQQTLEESILKVRVVSQTGPAVGLGLMLLCTADPMPFSG